MISPYISQLARSPLPREISALGGVANSARRKRFVEQPRGATDYPSKLHFRLFQRELASRFFAHDLREGRLLDAVVLQPATTKIFLNSGIGNWPRIRLQIIVE